MFAPITNTPRDYAWGSTTAIAELLGRKATGAPEAELWLGAHPASPSAILQPERVGGASDLAQWIENDPAAALGGRVRLPFLLKVLAAHSPLSLQAHPTESQARDGFFRENELGLPVESPIRNYRDENAKPEIIVAVSETFEALCGFRPHDDAVKAFRTAGLDDLVPMLDDLPALLAWLLNGGRVVDELLEQLAGRVAASGRASGDVGTTFDDLDTVRILGESHPGDPGIVCALLLNRVTLRRGEALYLPAGNIHAYLSGVGIEVMTDSDNVLRGGLTSKHVDVPELLRVLDFSRGPAPRLEPEHPTPAITTYRPRDGDFQLSHVTGDADVTLTGPAIAVCTSGSLRVDGAIGSIAVGRGESVYITPDESRLAITGTGDLYVATTR